MTVPASHQYTSLFLLLGKKTIDAVTVPNVGEGALTHRRYDLDPDTDYLSAVRKTVYDNSALTAEYQDVTILIDTLRFLIMPPETDTETAEKALETLYPDAEPEVILNPLNYNPAAPAPVLAAAIDPALTGFMRRTYGNPAILHALTPLVKYFGIKNRLGSAGKLSMHIEAGQVSVVAFDTAGLLMANIYEAPTVNDAAYYTLAAARMLDFDARTDTLSVSGEAKLRDEALAVLRQFIPGAMPAIFPADIFSPEALAAPFQAVIASQLKNI